MKRWSILLASLLAGVAHAGESGRTFFVSSMSGDDSFDGLSAQSPWRSLSKVNAAELRPGDAVLFQRGGLWRGTLVPHSGREGAPVTYGAYGEGVRPLLLGSVSRGKLGDWHQEGDHIWATSSHDNLVEGCRIWEVYDAALTNQGSANNSQVNITYRNNVIWNCEYSFEYWNRGPESTTQNIRFEHNTCVSAGQGWGHLQRPDRNGRHLMFYVNSARTTGVHVVGNIFCNATDSCLRTENDWTAGLIMNHNCWWQQTGVLMQFLRTPFTAVQFADFQKRTQMDIHSIVADPGFLNADGLDFRLSPGSPARTVAGDGFPAGSGRRLEQ